jgi:DNA mismatch repair protein MutL
MKIKRLPKEIYDLIAAGEVVLGPVSVVKELVENALDAGASRIIVEISEGGKERIRVSDNGSGIEKDELKLAFAPHATSKLDSVGALEHIETLGFRGEALASISAVSRVTMTTKTESEEIGACLKTEGGSEPTITSSGADKGTDVIVENLFFNIPARKKHMGDARSEGRKITEYLSKAAVSRPDVALRLISDGALVFATLGKGDQPAAIATVYGNKTAENLIKVKSESEKMQIYGYISGVLGLRNNRKGQHFFVNGRPVKNAAMEISVSRAYQGFAEPGRFPVVFLFLSIDPSLVDVNVHPAKNEISFVDQEDVTSFVFESLSGVLKSGTVIPKLKISGVYNTDQTFKIGDDPSLESTKLCENMLNIEKKSNYIETIVSTSGGTGEKVELIDIKHVLSSSNMDKNGIMVSDEHKDSSESMVYHNRLQETNDKKDSTYEKATPFAEKVDDHYGESLNINDLRVIASLFATYLLAASGDTFYIIDQHAAHERVNYEHFRNAYKNGDILKQELLTPYMFEPPVSLEKLSSQIDFLEKLGYSVEEFGEKTWVCRTFPAFVEHIEGEAFLLETLDILGSEKEEISSAAADRIMMKACKDSVKANKNMSGEESSALLKELSDCENPYTCPHGRPVFLKLTRRDIEKLFKRA